MVKFQSQPSRPVKPSSNAGFTLIELLVVIAIIGLLASVVLVALNSSRVKARDTRRKADLKQMNTALALYYNDNGRYPIVARWATSAPTASYDPTGTKWALLTTALSPYMSELPSDPSESGASGPWSTGSLHYAYSSDGIIYDLVAQLENTNDPDRCQIRTVRYHQGEGAILPETSWCGSYSPYMYADH